MIRAPFRRTDPINLPSFTAPPEKLGLDDLTRTTTGRVDIRMDDVDFECFVTPSKTKRLFVFLSSSGRDGPATEFHRVTWAKYLNATCVSVEDPMYKLHENLWGGWYYGTKAVSYLGLVIKLVQKLASLHKISVDNIFFVGSSSAGYASLYAADRLRGSVALAYNPQIDPGRSFYANTFETWTGLDLRGDDPLGRNSVKGIVDNTRSRFVITTNTFSKEDYANHSGLWLAEMLGTQGEGVHRVGPVTFILHRAESFTPHWAFPDLPLTVVLLNLLFGGRAIDDGAINDVATMFGTVNKLNVQLAHANLWQSVLRSLPGTIARPPVPDGSMMELSVINMPTAFRYRVVLEQGGMVTMALLVPLGASSTDPERIAAVQKCAARAEARVERREGGVLAIKRDRIPYADAAPALVRFIAATLAPMRTLAAPAVKPAI